MALCVAKPNWGNDHFWISLCVTQTTLGILRLIDVFLDLVEPYLDKLMILTLLIFKGRGGSVLDLKCQHGNGWKDDMHLTGPGGK